MPTKPKRWKFKAFLFLLLAGVAGWWYLKQQHTEQDRHTLIARIEALSHMLNSTRGKERITQWDAGIFVPNQAVNQTLDLLVDKTLVFAIEIDKIKFKGDVEIKLKSARLDSKQGTGLGKAEVEVSIPKLKTNLIAAGSVWFGIKSITADKDDPNRQRIVPIFRLHELRPKADIGDFGFYIKGLSADILGAPLIQQVNNQMADALKQGILLPKPKNLELRHDSTGEVQVGSSKVAFSYILPGAAIPIPWRFSSFAVVPDGIWLLLSDGPSSVTQHPDRKERTIKDLSAELATLEEAWKEVAQYFKPNSPDAVQLWVSRTIFQRMGEEVGKLSPEARQFRMTSQGATGPLFEDRWRDDILGEGGVKVGLANPQGLETVISGGQPSVAWSEQAGLGITIPYSVANDSKLHFHVDPLIGGGAGTTIGCEGRSEGEISFQARLETIRRDEIEGVGLVITTKTPSLGVEAETDGKFKVDWGWTKVPRVGLRVKIPIPEKVLPPLLLYDNTPFPTCRLSIPDKLSKLRWKETSPILQASLSRFSVQSGSEGMLVTATPRVEVVTQEIDLKSWLASRTKEIQLWGENWKKLRDEVKDQEPTVALTVGKMEFGPNNDLAAFLRAVGKTIDEIMDILKRNGIDAPQDKVLEWIGKPSESLAKSDVGKALQKVEAEAKKHAERVAAEAQEAAKRIEEEARKAKENLVDKPVDYLKKRFGL